MSTSVLKALPGKLDIKRHSSSILDLLSTAMAAILFDGTKPILNYSSELFEEHFCEIILNLDKWFRRRCRFSSGNGVARTLKKLSTSKRDYWIEPWFSSFGSLFKMGTFLRKDLVPRGSEFFLLRAVPYGMEINFITGDLPWMLLFLLRTSVTAL